MGSCWTWTTRAVSTLLSSPPKVKPQWSCDQAAAPCKMMQAAVVEPWSFVQAHEVLNPMVCCQNRAAIFHFANIFRDFSKNANEWDGGRLLRSPSVSLVVLRFMPNR